MNAPSTAVSPRARWNAYSFGRSGVRRQIHSADAANRDTASGEADGGKERAGSQTQEERARAHGPQEPELGAEPYRRQSNQDAHFDDLVDDPGGWGVDHSHRTEQGHSQEAEYEERKRLQRSLPSGACITRDRGAAAPPDGDDQDERSH